MRNFWVACAMTSATLLAGCFESDRDLIGNNAVELKQADGIFIFENAAYYVEQVGKDVIVCQLQRRPGLPDSCGERYEAKLERTALGNYIIQVHGGLGSLGGKRYFYVLWNHSRPDYRNMSCAIVLGYGYTGNDPLSQAYRSALMATSPQIYNDIGDKLRKQVNFERFNRQDLLFRRNHL